MLGLFALLGFRFALPPSLCSRPDCKHVCPQQLFTSDFGMFSLMALGQLGALPRCKLVAIVTGSCMVPDSLLKCNLLGYSLFDGDLLC